MTKLTYEKFQEIVSKLDGLEVPDSFHIPQSMIDEAAKYGKEFGMTGEEFINYSIAQAVATLPHAESPGNSEEPLS